MAVVRSRPNSREAAGQRGRQPVRGRHEPLHPGRARCPRRGRRRGRDRGLVGDEGARPRHAAAVPERHSGVRHLVRGLADGEGLPGEGGLVHRQLVGPTARASGRPARGRPARRAGRRRRGRHAACPARASGRLGPRSSSSLPHHRPVSASRALWAPRCSWTNPMTVFTTDDGGDHRGVTSSPSAAAATPARHQQDEHEGRAELPEQPYQGDRRRHGRQHVRPVAARAALPPSPRSDHCGRRSPAGAPSRGLAVRASRVNAPSCASPRVHSTSLRGDRTTA